MKKTSDPKNPKDPKKPAAKRAAATAALLLIALLYLATLVFAFLDHPLAKNCLMAALFCTIVVPVLIYIYAGIIRYYSRKQKGDDAS